MPRRSIAEEPYPGQPPAVKPGDLIWCRTAGGLWRDATTFQDMMCR
jgi:hypothetical protein